MKIKVDSCYFQILGSGGSAVAFNPGDPRFEALRLQISENTKIIENSLKNNVIFLICLAISWILYKFAAIKLDLRSFLLAEFTWL